MPSQEDEKQDEVEESQEPAPHQPSEAAVAQPKPELHIIDFSEKKINPFCTLCGLEKDRFLEIEVKGVIEYTCRDCYRKSHSGQLPIPSAPPALRCRKCGEPMTTGDNFCGKCGNPAVLRCNACNNEVEEEDRFCAKCGARLFAAQ